MLQGLIFISPVLPTPTQGFQGAPYLNHKRRNMKEMIIIHGEKILSINPREVSETPTGLTFNTFSTAMKPEPGRLTLGDPAAPRHLGVARLLESPETLIYQS